ncbi:CobW family GTP-binding protein [Tabrizicola sp. BL-A-41-H6]|uniref:CobW family GTP-binding protein n=1 Tax=Tabrizicola sp. BL-A-41-H6 TaxID=3421107 RepID=UPI003D67CA70
MLSDDRIQLTVLAGFLGSGKSTWLRHQVRHGVFAEAQLVVNEAAGTSVDDILIPGATVIAGGCVCCSARDDLLAVLRELCTTMGKSGARRIVLETSGLADPGPMVDAIRTDAGLNSQLVVSEVLVAIDAAQGRDLLRAEPLARRQVGAADCLIVTKLDQGDPPDTAALLATLDLLNPRAARFGAVKGAEVQLPDVDGAVPDDPDATADAGPVFATTLSLDGVDWAAFEVWLSALLHARGDDVLRVKGVVRKPGGRWLVQSVRRTVYAPEALPHDGPGGDNTVVVIGRGYGAADLAASLALFRDADPDNPWHQFP